MKTYPLRTGVIIEQEWSVHLPNETQPAFEAMFAANPNVGHAGGIYRATLEQVQAVKDDCLFMLDPLGPDLTQELRVKNPDPEVFEAVEQLCYETGLNYMQLSMLAALGRANKMNNELRLIGEVLKHDGKTWKVVAHRPAKQGEMVAYISWMEYGAPAVIRVHTDFSPSVIAAVVEEVQSLEDCTCYPDLAMTLGGSYEGTPDPNCKVHGKVN